MITYRKTNSMMDAFQSLSIMNSMNENYPDFYDWYVNKVIPDIASRNGIMIVAEDKNQLVGVSIAKIEDEKKLRCVRVSPEYQNKGVGIHLIDRTLKEMNADKPLTTVSEHFFHSFSRILINRFDFNLTKVERGVYKQGVLEYMFNGKSDLKFKTSY